MDGTEIATHAKVASAVMVGGTSWSLMDLPYGEIAAILTCLVGIAQLIIAAPKVYAIVKDWINKIRGKNGSDT